MADQPEGGDGAENDEPTDEGDEQADEQAEAQPDLGDEDLVDVPDEMAEQVASETVDDDGGDEQGEGDDGDGGDGGDTAGDDAGSSPLTSGTSVGDVYCNALGMAATMARERHGSGLDDADRQDQMDEYGDLARQCDLDEFVDEYVETRDGPDELTPGQGIVVGTLMFGMFVATDDPALVDGLADEMGGS